MNKTYLTVWNESTGTWVATSEITKAQGKASRFSLAATGTVSAAGGGKVNNGVARRTLIAIAISIIALGGTARLAQAHCPPMVKAAPVAKRYTLAADALFAFDRGGLSDLNPKGKNDLANLTTQLKQLGQLNSIKITGHTDYLGFDSYNLRLSEQRAQTVRQYFISQGLPANKIYAVGMGESQPVTECASTGNRSALIACLQPNRRVEVEVDGLVVVK